MPLTNEDLAQFTGTENWYRHWTGALTYTDGVKYLAGEGGAYWLIDAIASHQTSPGMKRDPRLRDFQLWHLHVSDSGKAHLRCQADIGKPDAISQWIPYTDFPLSYIRLYVEAGGPEGKPVLMLPSER